MTALTKSPPTLLSQQKHLASCAPFIHPRASALVLSLSLKDNIGTDDVRVENIQLLFV